MDLLGNGALILLPILYTLLVVSYAHRFLGMESWFSRSASKLSVVCASSGTQSALGSSRERTESFSIASDLERLHVETR